MKHFQEACGRSQLPDRTERHHLAREQWTIKTSQLPVTMHDDQGGVAKNRLRKKALNIIAARSSFKLDRLDIE